MASANKLNSFVEALAEKTHNLGSDTLKVMLTNSAPIATNTVKANLTEISAGNGYTAGGTQASQVSSAQTSGTYKLVCSDVTFTASGGSIGALQYITLYNDTATNDELILWWNYGSSITLADGEALTVDFSGTNGVLTIT